MEPRANIILGALSGGGVVCVLGWFFDPKTISIIGSSAFAVTSFAFTAFSNLNTKLATLEALRVSFEIDRRIESRVEVVRNKSKSLFILAIVFLVLAVTGSIVPATVHDFRHSALFVPASFVFGGAGVAALFTLIFASADLDQTIAEIARTRDRSQTAALKTAAFLKAIEAEKKPDLRKKLGRA